MGKAEESTSRPPSPASLSQELGTLPLVDSLVELYDSAKRNCILGTGLQLAERSCTAVVGHINVFSGDKVSAVDRYLGEYALSIKSQYPILQESTSEIIDQVKETASRMSKNGARGVVRSLPGQVLLTGLDGLVSMSAVVLCYVQPKDYKKSRSASPRKPVRTNKENGRSKTRIKSTETSKSTQTKKSDKSGGNRLLKEMYITLLVSPLRLTVGSMAKLSAWLNRLDGRKKLASRSCVGSPEKKAEIESRRKASPRKRVNTSFLGKVRRTAKRFLGLGIKAVSLTQSDIRSYLSRETGKSPVSDDGEKKRKYDEIQTDPDSDDTLADFDLDQYLSDEDSDYEVPSDAISTDSMEYAAGDTESEVSVEEATVGKVHIKTREQPKGTVAKGGVSPRKQVVGKPQIGTATAEGSGKTTKATDAAAAHLNVYKETTKTTLSTTSSSQPSKNTTQTATKAASTKVVTKDTANVKVSIPKFNGTGTEKSGKDPGSAQKTGSGP